MERVYLREWRTYKSLSQADLARFAGVSRYGIQLRERPGTERRAQPGTRRKLAAALGVAPHELLAPPPTAGATVREPDQGGE